MPAAELVELLASLLVGSFLDAAFLFGTAAITLGFGVAALRAALARALRLAATLVPVGPTTT